MTTSCIPTSFVVEELNCTDGTVKQTSVVANNTNAAVAGEFYTVLQEYALGADLAEHGGNFEGQLYERMTANDWAGANQAAQLADIVKGWDGYEVQGPGFAEVILQEFVQGGIQFTTARVLTDLYVFLADGCVATDMFTQGETGNFVALAEYIIGTDAVQDRMDIKLLEFVIATDELIAKNWLVQLQEGGTALDAVSIAFFKILSESAVATDAVDSWYMLAEFALAVDRISVINNMTLEERADALDSLVRVIAESLDESATGLDNILLTQLQYLAEAVIATDGMVLSLPVALNESVIGEEELSTAGSIYKALLEEAATGMVWLDIAGETMVFSVNPRLKGVTTYDDWDFNSYATDAQGQMWAANAQGVWRITEKPEAAVKSRIKFAKESFGTEGLKSMEQAYLGLTTDGDLVLSYENDEGTKAVYRVTPQKGLKTTRVKLGRGSIGRWFTFELEDVDATEFRLDELSLVPIAFSRVMR